MSSHCHWLHILLLVLLRRETNCSTTSLLRHCLMPRAMAAIYLCILATLIGSFTAVWSQDSTWPPPPPWWFKAKMARYLIHYADWGVVSSISPEFGYQPYGTVQSFCDGPIEDSSGWPYFYIADISDTGKNIKYNNTVSFTVSQAMSTYCERTHRDPEDPTCSRVTVTGKMIKVTGTERTFANHSLFARHPAMKYWPHDHHWNFYKINLTGIYLLDNYGPLTTVPLSDYFKAKPPFAKKSVHHVQ